MKFFPLLISSFAIIQMATAGDPDVLSDFIVPPNVTNVDGSFFTFTGLRTLVTGGQPITNFNVSKVSLAQFPALNGQSVSYAVLEYAAGTHNHPTLILALLISFSSSEVPFKSGLLIRPTSSLLRHYKQVISLCKGFVHFQYNNNSIAPAIAIAAFGYANAGNVSMPNTLFTTGIDSNVLAKSFKNLRLVLLPCPEDSIHYE